MQQLRFFHKATRHHGEPEVMTIDKNGTKTAVLGTLNADKPKEERSIIRQNKCLNNLAEQDHRNIKRKIRQVPGFKSFRPAQVILAGTGLIHIIHKGQSHHSAGNKLSAAEPFCLLAA